MTQQPERELLANLGDASDLDSGGYFVYRDKTKVYGPEAEFLTDTNNGDGYHYLYRFTLDRQKIIEDTLVPFNYKPDWPHPLQDYSAWFTDSLAAIADYVGLTLAELTIQLCSENPLELAEAYRAIGDYHGFHNLDADPARLTETEAREHYKQS